MKYFLSAFIGVALALHLVAAEYRVPLGGIRTYDNSQDWFRTHADNFPLKGEAVDSLAEFSTSVWVCVREYPVTDMTARRHVASIFSRGWSQELRLTPGGELLNFYCMTDRETFFPARAHLRKGHWTHVVTTFSVSKQQLATYMNGIKKSQYDLGISPIRPQAAGCTLTVGQSAEHWNPFDGRIADLRWYDHALTVEEVMELYTNPPSEIAEELANEEEAHNFLAIYPVAAPLGAEMVLPQTQFSDDVPQLKELAITLTPGEYEPGAIALYAPSENLQNVSVALVNPPVSDSGGNRVGIG